MAFDECTPYPIDGSAGRGLDARSRCAGPSAARPPSCARPGHGLFGIVQGSVYPDAARGVRPSALVGDRLRRLRGRRPRGRRGPGRRCSRCSTSRCRCCRPTGRATSWASASRPISSAPCARGIDMFDCVLPTRSGRTGQAFTRRGALNIRNARHARRSAPARRGLRLPGLPQLQPRLPAPSLARRGDPRPDAADLAQPALLPGADGRPARRDRRGSAWTPGSRRSTPNRPPATLRRSSERIPFSAHLQMSVAMRLRMACRRGRVRSPVASLYGQQTSHQECGSCCYRVGAISRTGELR